MNLGADIIMAFDECPPYPAPREAVAEADRAHHALGASAAGDAHRRPDQWLFGIVQGGVHLDLRERSARGDRRARLPRATRSAASRWASPRRT